MGKTVAKRGAGRRVRGEWHIRAWRAPKNGHAMRAILAALQPSIFLEEPADPLSMPPCSQALSSRASAQRKGLISGAAAHAGR